MGASYRYSAAIAPLFAIRALLATQLKRVAKSSRSASSSARRWNRSTGSACADICASSAMATPVLMALIRRTLPCTCSNGSSWCCIDVHRASDDVVWRARLRRRVFSWVARQAPQVTKAWSNDVDTTTRRRTWPSWPFHCRQKRQGECLSCFSVWRSLEMPCPLRHAQIGSAIPVAQGYQSSLFIC